jgi:antimicrobial peptide system SdpB family protein
MHLSRVRLVASADLFEPRGNGMAIGRSLLAGAGLTVLLANPDSVLFGDPHSQASTGLCAGIDRATLWCIAGSGAQGYGAARVLATLVLAAVVVGFRPRWLCVPHWYVAFSLGVRMTPVDGGDLVAQILALLLIPMCLGDRRVWHWQSVRQPLAPAWRGASYAAHVIVRCQIVVIYLEAALSKLAYPAWRHGTALPTILNDPYSGLPIALRPVANAVLASPWVAAPLTWGVIALEVAIALSMLFGSGIRRLGLVISVLLHAGIIAAMGLFSFGLIMIALLLVVSVEDPGR